MAIDPRNEYANGSGARDAVDTNTFDASLAALKTFEQAIVIETLCDPALRATSTDELEKIKKDYQLVNFDDYLRAPRNSIICRAIADQNTYVTFPFFSSHVSLPVKSGETVWIYRQFLSNNSSFRPYWLSRVPGEISTEDANFTCEDRKNFLDYKNDKVDDESGNRLTPRKLKFPSGDWRTWTNETPKSEKTYLNFITGSKEFGQTKISAVPRITKRPGDLVLQGSNNSSITLGTLYGWNSSLRPSKDSGSSIATKSPADSASIDIVVGRGRLFSSELDESKKPKNEAPVNSTKPLIVENESGFEVDKGVASVQDKSDRQIKGNTRTNPQEGDPDYLLDASRVMLSDNAKIDNILDTGPNGLPKKISGSIKDLAGASIAIKSDHVRIVARKTKDRNSGNEPDDVSEINGSIRIVKEGTSGDQGDLATILIEPDGTIHISGSKIYIGRAKGDGAKDGDALEGGQPYIRYKQLEKLWQDTMSALDTFCTTLAQHVTPGMGAPSPQITKAAVDLKAAIASNLKPNIERVKSERIFGE